MRHLRADARNRPDAGRGFTIAVGGRERSDDVTADRRYVAALDAAGVDWWHEYVPPHLPYGQARQRIADGPVRAERR